MRPGRVSRRRPQQVLGIELKSALAGTSAARDAGARTLADGGLDWRDTACAALLVGLAHSQVSVPLELLGLFTLDSNLCCP